MSDMKCPFCQQELDYLAEDIYGNMYCPNCRDKNGFTYKASESIWQELIRTHKALDVAVDALKRTDWCAQDYAIAQDALDEITKLEQKDK
jgi:phage FluMu protein Com